MTEKPHSVFLPGYETLHSGIVEFLESARCLAARSVNALMTATYWEIGWRIVEAEQGGKERAEYGEKLLARLAKDLTARFGRGFGAVNLSQMRRFYQTWPVETIFQTVSEKSETSTWISYFVEITFPFIWTSNPVTRPKSDRRDSSFA